MVDFMLLAESGIFYNNVVLNPLLNIVYPILHSLWSVQTDGSFHHRLWWPVDRVTVDLQDSQVAKLGQV